MRVAVYARFSDSDLQHQRSIDDQVALCRDLAARTWPGAVVVKVFSDSGMSGAHAASRPGYQRLLAEARAGEFDAVVAEALDRLSRDLEDTAGLFKRMTFADVPIVTVAEGHITELHVGLKGTMNAGFLKDLGIKIRRGQTGRVKAGFCPGGRAYGYKVVRALDAAGELVKGRREVAPDEARVIVRIFEAYAAGRSARAIAAELNAEGLPAPRGGRWTVSTINGNRSRRNGILWNEGYLGRLVYNRARMVRDPETGRRLPRRNGAADWVTVEAPHLRIVADDLWARAQERKARYASFPAHVHRRPKRLLSGLIECGCCGGGVTVVRPGRLGCAARRGGGACENGAGIAPEVLEARVVEGLKRRLLRPKAVEAFVREWNAGMKERRRAAGRARAAAEKELREIAAREAKIVEAIETGGDAKVLVGRLAELEGRRVAIEAALASEPPDNVVELHPTFAGSYRARVADLERSLAREDTRAEAAALLRALIDRVIVRPTGRRGEWSVELVGKLTGLLALAAGDRPQDPASMLMVVAEVRVGHWHTLPTIRVFV